MEVIVFICLPVMVMMVCIHRIIISKKLFQARILITFLLSDPFVEQLAHSRRLTDILDLLLPLIPPDGLLQSNESQSTPLHWVALNGHLNTVKKLINYSPGPGPNLIDQKNKAGRTPLGEAEMAGWDEGAQFMVSVMNLATGSSEPIDVDDDEGVDVDAKDIEVEIEDADGGVAKMTISGKHTAESQNISSGVSSSGTS